MARVIVGPSDSINVRIGPEHPVKARTGADVVPVYITIKDVRFKEIREDGSYVYTIVMTTGAEFDFVAPIGPEGIGINNIKLNDDYTLTITLDDGTEYTTAPIRGEKGETGIGIQEIRWIGGTHQPGQYDTYRVIYTSGDTFEFQVYNGADGAASVKFGTKAEWDAQTTLIGERNTIYVYTDAVVDDFGIVYARFKVGNGIGYLLDLPFTDNLLYNHIHDSTIHITQEEREFWNNKVRNYISEEQPDMMIFTTN